MSSRSETSAAYSPRDLAEQTLDGTLPYEETWRENATNLLILAAEVERLRGERFDTSDVKVRDLGLLACRGLTIMRDDGDDEDGWELPDLVTINRALSAVGALVQHAEDRMRFRRALNRIGKEWTEESATPDDIREFAKHVLSGGSARVPLAFTPSEPTYESSAANDLVARRRAIYEWAKGDPMLLSARCAKAEAELERLLAAALTSPQEAEPNA